MVVRGKSNCEIQAAEQVRRTKLAVLEGAGSK